VAIVAGIDEAGLGPVLGPLVVSATAFELPEELVGADLWRLLASAVCTKSARAGGKVAIADSKKLYSRQKPNALEGLERGVLAMLAAASGSVDTLRGLLKVLAPHGAAEMAGYPWYDGQDLALPLQASPTDLSLAGNALRTAMKDAGLRPVGLWSEPVQVGEFNRHVQATDNKSTMLFDVTSRLLGRLWASQTDPLLRVYVDRQGGRTHYLPGLQRLFDGAAFKVVDENDRFSAYRITCGSRRMELCFLVGGEKRHLPVALASMVSKYLRELFMELFNRFWQQHVPALAPTAGYYTDGRRFVQDILPAMKSLGIDQGMLYRSR
jgi:ribonuclease HII